MLKIKDNVDLKELEKYGFQYYEKVYVKEIERAEPLFGLGESKKIYVDDDSQNISIGIGLYDTDIELDTIYDLINDGLVEKEDDKNEQL